MVYNDFGMRGAVIVVDEPALTDTMQSLYVKE